MEFNFIHPCVIGPYVIEFILDPQLCWKTQARLYPTICTCIVITGICTVYLPNNLLCATTSPCMPCITHVFTMINIWGQFSRVLLLPEQIIIFCFWRDIIVNLHVMYLATAGDLWKSCDMTKRNPCSTVEASFAFVNHSASKSQGWVVQIEYSIAEYVSISRLVVVHCICTNLSFFSVYASLCIV